MELSEARLDEIWEIFEQKTEDAMMDWIDIQPDKDLIYEFFNALIPKNPSAQGLPKLNP